MTEPRPSQRTRWIVLGAIAGGVVLVLAWLYRGAVTRPDYQALVSQQGVDWIVYPRERWFRHMNVTKMDTTFEQTVAIGSVPETAPLQLRAYRQCLVLVNGRLAFSSDLDHDDWKRTDTVDVAAYLQTGDNEFRVIVNNPSGPPALWFRLDLGDELVVSDRSWQSSFAEATSRTAIPAWHKRGTQRRGQDGPRTTTAFANSFLELLLLALLSAGLWFGARAWFRRRGDPTIGRRIAIGLVVAIGVLSLARFANNAEWLSRKVGFDSRAHLSYIASIQRRSALPEATSGVQTHQPPLYYLLNAVAGAAFGVDIRSTSGEGSGFARFLSTLLGIAQLAFLFGSLRILLPDKPLAQFAGLLFVAFLPMHGFLYHYITNETMNGTTCAATLYALLRIVVSGRTSVLSHVGLGVALGAALLSKISAFLLLPVVFVALAAKLYSDRQSVVGWAKTIGVTAVVALIVAGWHYIPVWIEYGTPFVRRIEEGGGADQWKNPGYHTFASLFRFGDSLVRPIFAGFDSLPDALYSTFWGDGRMGGSVAHDVAPPWNYELMTANYLLALLPMALIAIGFVLGTVRFVRKPTIASFCLLALVFGMAAALIREQLLHPHLITAKGWYAIPIVTSLAALCAYGFDWATRSRPRVAATLMIALVWWAATSYASFWVRASGPDATMYLAIDELKGRNAQQSAAMLNESLKAHPNHVGSLLAMSEALMALGQHAQARTTIERALQLDRDNPNVLLQCAKVRDPRVEAAAARQFLVRALQVAPDFLEAFDLAATERRAAGDFEAEAAFTREILRVRPRRRNLPRHYANLARACFDLDRYDLALRASLYALESARYSDDRVRDNVARVIEAIAARVRNMRAGDVETARQLSWLTAVHPEQQVRDLFEPLPLAERVAAHTERKDPAALATLAAAYADAGRFDDARATAEEALSLPDADRDRPLLKLLREGAGELAQGRPLRLPQWSPAMVWWCAQR